MLLLHTGAKEVLFNDLKQISTPLATQTHVPIPHHDVIDRVRYALNYYGHRIVEEHHGITPDGMRYFGTLSLISEYDDYEDTVGLRNSHDKKFPIGISIGARVFVCDNLSFSGDHVIRRKHTSNARRDLPGLVAEIIEPLAEARKKQYQTMQLYKYTEITQPQVDNAIMELYRQNVINVQRIAEVHNEWEAPSYLEFADGFTAWRLFNAVTHVLAGRVVENPINTRKLHNIIDGVCVRV